MQASLDGSGDVSEVTKHEHWPRKLSAALRRSLVHELIVSLSHAFMVFASSAITGRLPQCPFADWITSM